MTTVTAFTLPDRLQDTNPLVFLFFAYRRWLIFIIHHW